jgi:hypothetical protein
LPKARGAKANAATPAAAPVTNSRLVGMVFSPQKPIKLQGPIKLPGPIEQQGKRT